MTFLENKLNGITRRIHSIKYGMFYWGNKDYKIPGILKINGEKKKLKVADMNIIEFTGLCINDCYHLGYLKKKLGTVNSIVDVGANSGMFTIAARQFFPEAGIHCYEPNPYLAETLSFNAKQLNAVPYMEAVMKEDCHVNLNFTESDLATTASKNEEGNVTGSSLATVIKRIGEIDILKLDCEGAEWGILEDRKSFQQIRSLTMEYHLSVEKGMDIKKLFQLLTEIDFTILHHTVLSGEQGIVVAINKSKLLKRNYDE
jgi:FkbM family methyltransferase